MQNTREPLLQFLNRSLTSLNTSSSFDTAALLSSLMGSDSASQPKIGIAVSGGGYRSMLTGAGILAAMDNRTRGAQHHGLGGLLQSTTYLSGASGGNWLVGTLAYNNWTSVQSIIDNFNESDSIWDLSESIVSPGGKNIFKSARRWDHISDALQDKQKAGFDTSLADVWGRALSYKFFPSLYRGGVAYTWSSLRDSPVFTEGQMPFPISVADGRYPGSKVLNLNATVFEFNPFEMGSWDPSLNTFTDVKFLGTNVSAGKPIDSQRCVQGFDNTAFIMGTSSTLFNQFLLRINSTNLHLPGFITKLATHFLKDISQDFNDVATYHPNPFKDANFIDANYTKSIVNSKSLYLVDGGEDDENIPLLPLIQRERDLDIVFAIDNSMDMKLAWPDGSSLVHTFERQFVRQGQGMAFPYVPGTDTFVNLGLNQKPTFFGCDAHNLTDLEYIPPLVIYLPNKQYSFPSNQSAFKLSYTEEQRRAMISNGFEIATRNNFTDDPDFLGCIGCAIIRRKQQSLNLTLPEGCNTCFTNYCWNGTLDTTPLPDNKKDIHNSFINVGVNRTDANAKSDPYVQLHHHDEYSEAVEQAQETDTVQASDLPHSYQKKDSHNNNNNNNMPGGPIINIKVIMALLCLITFMVGFI